MFDTSCSVDNWTFKCFYRVTTAVMISCSVLVTARQFFGAPIACDAGAVRKGGREREMRGGEGCRGAMIPALDPDSDFLLFGDSRSVFGSGKKLFQNTYRSGLGSGVRFSASGFGSRKKWNRNTSRGLCFRGGSAGLG